MHLFIYTHFSSQSGEENNERFGGRGRREKEEGRGEEELEGGEIGRWKKRRRKE